MVLQENHFAEPNKQERSFICSSARLRLLLTRKWSREFLAEISERRKNDSKYQKAEREAGTAKERRKNPSNKVTIEEGLLYWENRLWLPNDERLIQAVLESEPDTKVAGHMAQDRTIELIRRNFWWPKMNE